MRYSFLTALVLLATIVLNVYLYIAIPKGFFPQQDTGQLIGGIQADQSISFQAMRKKFIQLVDIVHTAIPRSRMSRDSPADIQTNSGSVFASLKPLSERTDTADQIVAQAAARNRRGDRRPACSSRRCRTFASAAGRPMRNINTRCTPTISTMLRAWSPKILEALQKVPILADVNIDQQDKGLETDLIIDRQTRGASWPHHQRHRQHAL